MRSNQTKKNTVLLFFPLLFFPCLLLCVAIILVPAFVWAGEAAPNEQRAPDSPDPRKNVALLETEIEEFKLRMLPLLEGKSKEEATAVFFEEVEAFYDVVGQPFKWPWANFYDLYVFGANHNVQWGEHSYYIRGIPSPSDISEEEAISIAEKTILLLTPTPSEALEMYWAATGYYKVYADGEYSWYVNFVVETPENRAYYIKFALEIDPKTGSVLSFFDSRSNDY